MKLVLQDEQPRYHELLVLAQSPVDIGQRIILAQSRRGWHAWHQAPDFRPALGGIDIALEH